MWHFSDWGLIKDFIEHKVPGASMVWLSDEYLDSDDYFNFLNLKEEEEKEDV